MITEIVRYKNGQAEVQLYEDGTRIIRGGNFEYPLNLDIRVSTQCSFGQRPDGSYVLCDFCHESAKTNGQECDYELLKEKLQDLPPIELAIGCNQFTNDLYNFLEWCKGKFIPNLTINSGHLKRDKEILLKATENKLFYGIGISYRKGIEIPDWILTENTVIHVIAGIDDLDELKRWKKILVLGCKDFGFNLGKVNQDKLLHWKRNISKLFDHGLVCFDNLALEQLDIKRFLSKENWEQFYQGEFSFYIDAVNKKFARSSRESGIDWTNVKDYFKEIK